MGFILWLVIGGIVGWLASLVMRTDGQQGILLNIVVGIVGAIHRRADLQRAVTINPGQPARHHQSSWCRWSARSSCSAIVNLIRRGSVR